MIQNGTYLFTYDSLKNSLGRENFTIDNVLIDGVIPHPVFMQLHNTFLAERKELKGERDYNFKYLKEDPDFRALVGMQYVIELAKRMGVESELEPYLSIALGAQGMSVLDLAKTSQVFKDGKIRTLSEDEEVNQATSIVKITDSEGSILYEYDPVEIQLIAPELSPPMLSMLRSAVRFGTGKSLNKHFKVGKGDFSLMIPIYGKTGTSNGYKTSCFFGGVPFIPDGNGDTYTKLDPANGHMVAAYVGYDYPKKMINGRLKISGASGGLPIFRDVATYLAARDKIEDNMDLVSIMINGSNDEINFNFPHNSRLKLYRGSGIVVPERVSNEVISLADFSPILSVGDAETIIVPVYLTPPKVRLFGE